MNSFVSLYLHIYKICIYTCGKLCDAQAVPESIFITYLSKNTITFLYSSILSLKHV